MVVPAVFVAGVAVVALLWMTTRDRVTGTVEVGPVHVHGLGVNPADEALFIATHTGLWRLDTRDDKARRVGESHQDTMGFTVVGPDRFLGSGHPDLRTDLPPHLGLIESTDAGDSWNSVSLLGEADFHVLRYADGRLYGYDATNDRLLASDDRGRSWEELRTPGTIVDLAVHPRDAQRLVATSDAGVHASSDGGETWDRMGAVPALLAWPTPERLYLIDDGGEVFVSGDRGIAPDRVGSTGGEPAALLATGDEDLFVALHDGTVKRSLDGGATWEIRSTP
jgi:photosystem II stability/assembly factor-like uncharacterized protein